MGSKSSKKGKDKNGPPPPPGKVRVACTATVGAIALLIGAFAPLLRVRLHGELRYWDIAGLEGYLVVCAGTLTLVAMARRQQVWLVPTSIVLWAGLLYPYYDSLLDVEMRFHQRVRSAVIRVLHGSLTDVWITSGMVEFQWGAPLFAVGVLLLTVATLLWLG